MSEALHPTGEAPEPHFLFRLGETLLLCPAAAVEAVTSYEAPVPLPRAPAHVLGLVTYDQRALVVLDLARFLALPGDAAAARRRTLVVSAGAYRVGLPVDGALGVVPLAPTALRAGAHVFAGRLAEFVRAEADTASGLGAVLDLAPLLEAARA